MPEVDLHVLHRHVGERIVTSKKNELAALPLQSGSAELWWGFAKRMDDWRSMAENGRSALVVAGVADWMSERVRKGDQQQGIIDMAAKVFSAIDKPLAERVAELKRRRTRGKNSDEAVVLATMHAAKGLEWDRVWIVSLDQKVIPDEKSAIDEERRLLYVAMTRARESLVLSSSNHQVSPFVGEAGLMQHRQKLALA